MMKIYRQLKDVPWKRGVTSRSTDETALFQFCTDINEGGKRNEGGQFS